MKALANSKSSEYRFVGLSLTSTGLEEYVRDGKAPFPVYANAPPSVLAVLNPMATPQLLVVSQTGKVLKHWRGALQSGTKTDVESYFGVSLPGLRNASVPSATVLR